MTSREISNNVESEIVNLLKNQRINYVIHGGETDTINYEIFVGSKACWVQIETDDTDNEGYVVVQLYDTTEDSTFEESIELKSDDNIENVLAILIELIDYTKNKISVEAKIETLIQKIIDLCNQNQLNIDNYIEIVNYDMDFDGLD